MMKSKIILIALALTAVSCQKAEQNGSFSISLKEGEVADIVTRSSVSDYATIPSDGDFTLTLNNGKTDVWSGLLSDWDPETKLKAGNYTADVTFGDPEDEGYSKPYFAGSAEFMIFGGQNTDVVIPVTLGNCVVRIECTDAFRKYYPVSSFKVATGAGNEFDYTGGGLFIDAYKFTVSGKVTSQGGSSYDLAEKTWNVKAATCYTVKYDVVNAGGVTVTITFSDELETVSLTEDLNE